MNTTNTLKINQYPQYVKQVIATYFSNPHNIIFIKKDETLLKEGFFNDKIFYVKEGQLRGYWFNENKQPIESFSAKAGSFIGLPSYFSDNHICLNTVTALQDSTLHYITLDQTVEEWDETHSLEEQFMPLVINEMIHRQVRLQQLSKERAKTQEILAHHEKMAALGTISAGIAHELNNSIAVIQHSNDWLSQTIQELLLLQDQQCRDVFVYGLEYGRKLSSREARKEIQEIMKRHRLDHHTVEMLVHIHAPEDQIKPLAKNQTLLKTLHHYWELGATLRDMQTASEMATHVVRSVKAIGSKSSKMQSSVDINETITKATTLLTSSLRLVDFQQDLRPLLVTTCAKGELIQVWVNLMQNALDSMFADSIENPSIHISSQMVGKNIEVKIRDNGNGIPSEFVHRIFDPQFTTKSGEAVVGLGLGLTIVHKIISSHNGTISVESQPGNTTFTVLLPAGGNYE